MATKAQLEAMLLDANNRIIELQAMMPTQEANDFLYHVYEMSASVLEDHYVPNYVSWKNFQTREPLTDEMLKDVSMARFAHFQQAALQFDSERPHRAVVNRMKLCRLHTEYLGRQPWNLTWFGHTTFRDGRTDQELMCSFASYVDKYRWQQEARYPYTIAEFEKRYGEPYICLMGAEDQWRWEMCHCEECTTGERALIKH